MKLQTLTTSMKNYLLLTVLLGLVLGFAGIGCVSTCSLPAVPAYPERDPNTIVNEAKQISDDLDAYITQWLDGNAEGNIPVALIPKGVDPNILKINSFVIKSAASADGNDQWGVRYAGHEYGQSDHNRLRGAFGDYHATYLVSVHNLAPFGDKCIITGQFPHTRFFSIQVSPPFDPYVYEGMCGAFGECEVPIVDADINPDEGSVNPFRMGADRTATNRNYTVTLELKMGSQHQFDPNFCPRPPEWRGSGNTRYGSFLQYMGPFQDPNYIGPDGKPSPMLNKFGRWMTGAIWVRYYGPDKAYHPTAGVPYPQVTYKRPNGQTYYITCDWKDWIAAANLSSTNHYSDAVEPDETKEFMASWAGWAKMNGIFLGIVEGMSRSLGLMSAADRKYCRDLVLGVTGLGESQPGAGSYETTCSTVNHYTVLCRELRLGTGKVHVLTGKLPTYPDTRNAGYTTMAGAQVRYWSFTTYDQRADVNIPVGIGITSTLDDEIVLDSNRRYTVVYSTPANKPTNATSANGVTWVSTGRCQSSMNFDIRWVSVRPDWYMSPSPHADALPWTKSSWSGAAYDQNLIGLNRHDGYLGWYLPKSHYMTKAEFESMGSSIDAQTVLTWKDADSKWQKPYGWTEVYSTTSGDGGVDEITLGSVSGRFVMVDMTNPSATSNPGDPNYGYYSLWELEVLDGSNNNLALNKTVRTSDEYWYWYYPCINATDALSYTRWQSNLWKNGAWIYVDTKQYGTISKVRLTWYDPHYAKGYKVYVSNELQ